MSARVAAAVVVVLGAFVAARAQDADASPDFARDVRPVLARCLQCHAGDEPESALRLETRADALRAGESGRPALVPGDAAASELLRRVASRDPLERMPPGERAPLTSDEIARLARWIDAGAAWPDERATHWAFRPVRRPDVPAVHDAAWPRDALDAFVLARLEAAGMRPAPEADPATLARRLSLDLVGLPPDPSDVEALRRDPSTYDALVEKLLASPHFAERWARHWLDRAGYADSDGYENDKARPEAWRWRDWVIEAIDADLPFDRFVTEQVAGDLLPDRDRGTRLATGFFRQTLTNTEAGIDPEEFRVEAVQARVDLLGTALLGLTLGCARCHDHKYDPIPTRDYYALFAFFDDADEGTLRLPADPGALATYERQTRAAQQAIAPLEAAYEAARAAWSARATHLVPAAIAGVRPDGVVDLARTGSPASLRAPVPDEPVLGVALEVFPQAEPGEVTRLTLRADGTDVPLGEPGRSATWTTSDAYRHATWLVDGPLPSDAASVTCVLETRGAPPRVRLAFLAGGIDTNALPDDVRQAMSTPEAARTPQQRDQLVAYEVRSDDDVREALRALTRARKELPEHPAPLAQVLVPHAGAPREAHVLVRGDFLRPAELVVPGTPAVLPPLDATGARASRLDLARWLVDPAQPLTARVFVDDVWRHLFGEGLVGTPDDFGTRGEPPSHPELLDRLAWDVVHGGWSRKDLVRRIVRSATYRQASIVRPDAEAADPDARLLHRQRRVPVEAEIVRDQALAASGLLAPRVGGPSVFPPLPDGVADKSYANLFTWETSVGDDAHRRGMYTFFKRTAPHPHLVEFDAPSSLTSCPARMRSITPQQALVLLDDPVWVEAAAALARRVRQEADGDEARISRAFRLCLARAPEPAEVAALAGLLAEARAWYDGRADDARAFVGEPDAELAALAATLRVLFTLDEFLVRP
ncbi:MAG: PSD1 domain-containing protein [Planctomycetes bacterium]|nr:PSD1 domain-containing protein [Planctomycetota bacterium]